MGYLENYFEQTAKHQWNKGAIAYLAALDAIEEKSPEISSAIVQELKDQRSFLKLIASENYCSLPVQLAMGNLLTDKYAEGFVDHRFYAGCQNVDTVERRAEDLLKELFGCDAAYAQPHSGSDANLVAMWAIISQRVESKELEKLGKKNLDELTEEEFTSIRTILINQKMLGMSLNAGGHLTHGYRHNISSKILQAHHYDINPQTGLIDYDQIQKQAKQIKPLILLAGYSAYPRKINFAKMREIADSVGAVLMVDMAHFSGLVAGKVFTGDYNPIPFADIATSTTHKTLRGPRGGIVLCKKEFSEAVHRGCPLVMGGPLPHVMAAKAIAFQEALTKDYQVYAKKIVENSMALAEGLLKRGIELTTGGTENHLMVIKLNPFNLTGRQAEPALREAGMTMNRNAIPFDPNGRWYTSGLRIGPSALTTLGMGKQEMDEIADILFQTLKATRAAPNEKTGQPSKAQAITDPQVLKRSQQRVKNLLAQFPLYPELQLEKTETLSHNRK
jgi:glycine hydroxymethyltransferase